MTRKDDIGSSRTLHCCPTLTHCPTFSHCPILPCPSCPRLSSHSFVCFLLFAAVLSSSPAVLCTHLPSHPRRWLTSLGSSSILMTAGLEVQGREMTAFWRSVWSFSKVARQVGMRDEDGPRPAVPSPPKLCEVTRTAP